MTPLEQAVWAVAYVEHIVRLKEEYYPRRCDYATTAEFGDRLRSVGLEYADAAQGHADETVATLRLARAARQ